MAFSRINAAPNEEKTKRDPMEKKPRKRENKNRDRYAESKKAEEIYRSLLRFSTDAIVSCDMEGKVEYISPAFTRIFGWTVDEITGRQIPFVHDHENPSSIDILEDLANCPTPCNDFETKCRAKDSCLIDVSVSASRCDAYDGKSTGTLFILRDISEKKRIEAQLHYIERMEAIGTLAGGIAHDFNNLMMGMLGNISLILYDIGPEDPNYERLKTVESLIQSGAELTSKLLGYARKGKYELRLVNLNNIIAESFVTFGRARKEIVIHKDLAQALHPVQADESQLKQVLMNLFVNAAEAMPKGGDLFIQTQNVTHQDMSNKPYRPIPGQYVMIQIKDNGKGMEQKTMARVFEPFFTTKEMGRGSGLGLASAYGIIKGHGGYIDVESEKGSGSVFKIFLPVSEASIRKDSAVSEAVEKGNETVMLVDDEDMIIDVGSQLLEKLGYTVITAQGGEEAIRKYQENKNKIDMIILDMIMPDVGGSEVCEKIKKIDPEAKILLSSGYSINSQAMEILNKGCHGFIQKPFSLKDLSIKIREVLIKASKQRTKMP
jgi:two-component system, cell cycle sensor histidine kinase and response regulator CckA